MMARARDGVDYAPAFAGMFEKDLLQVFNGLLGMQAMQINIEFLRCIIQTSV